MQANEFRHRHPKQLGFYTSPIEREHRAINNIGWVVLFICALGLTAIYWVNH